MQPWKHFCTITKHRHAVIRHCFKAGIGWQGLGHDLSKYSPVEFWNSSRFYQGDPAPTTRSASSGAIPCPGCTTRAATATTTSTGPTTAM